MPTSRVHSYTPGQLARGDDVQDDFDNLITFVNNLEATKLESTGGTVANITVSGNFIAQGSSIFNAGLTVNNQPAVFNNTLDAMQVNGVATFNSTVFAAFVPSVGDHLTNKTYVDGELSTNLALYLKKNNFGSEYQKIEDTNISIQKGAGIEVVDFAGTPGATQERAILATTDYYNTLIGLPTEFLAFMEDPANPNGGSSAWTYLGRNMLKMTNGTNQVRTLDFSENSLEMDDSSSSGKNVLLKVNGGLKVTEGSRVGTFDHNRMLLDNVTDGTKFDIDADTTILWDIVGLPTSAPAGTGHVWSNGGVLTIT